MMAARRRQVALARPLAVALVLGMTVVTPVPSPQRASAAPAEIAPAAGDGGTNAKGAFTTRIQVLRHVRHCGGAFMAMAARHAFWLAGRARRIQHQREIFGACAEQWEERRSFKQFVEPVRATRRVVHGDAR